MISSALASSIMISPAMAPAQSVPTRSLGSPLWDLAGRVPSLDLRFAENRNLTDSVTGQNLITFSRTSDGTATNSSGNVIVVPAGTPRFDHNPITGESLGLLVEEQRTNQITNNTMSGVIAGTPGTIPNGWTAASTSNGVTREVIGIGTENGIAFVDIRYYGTSTGAGQIFVIPSTTTAITAASGQSWTGSAYVKVQSGSLSNLTGTAIFVTGRTAAGAANETVVLNYTPTSDPLIHQRRTASISLANASTERITVTAFVASYASGVAVDITLRIGLPQLEQGAFATSVIPTSGTAVTRTADVASDASTGFSSWYREDQGTFFMEVDSSNVAAARILQASDGTSANRQDLFFSGGSLTAFTAVSNSAQVNASTSNSVANGTAARIAYAYQRDNFAWLLNAGAAQTDTSGNLPTVNRLGIGQRLDATGFLNGHVKRLTFWPSHLPNSTLQAITG